MRRKPFWLALGVLLLAVLAITPLGAMAYHTAGGAPSSAAIPSTSAAPAGSALTGSLQGSSLPDVGVPLRANWWTTVPGIDPESKLNYALLSQFQGAPNSTQGFMVYLKAQANTSNAITDWKAKGEYVLHALETVQNATQPALQQAVDAQQSMGNVTKSMHFTIINAIFVHGNLNAAMQLARRNDVAFIDPDHRYFPMDDGAGAAVAANAVKNSVNNSPSTIELGVNYVHAPQVWALGDKGEGVVVGHIDTGVQYDHPALVAKYRGNLGGGNFDHNYNWWDARTDQPPQPVPYDDGGHGTHTIGTVLGDDGDPGTNQIGVAPHAKFISAKVFPNDGSSGNEEITPAEDFMLAPWDLNHQNRRPDLRPNIVTNSWGDNECWNTDSWLITQAWIDAGIMPVFANGNAGPGSGTVGSPGGYPFLMGVGAVDASTNVIAGFSSRGPSCFGGVLKPDASAPGVNVRSSVPGNSYAILSGTSMATPHMAGVMALMLSANPSLTYTDVMGIITRTAYFASNWGTRPNNNYGWGAVRADAAYNMAVHGPHLHGTIDVGGTPLQGVDITAVNTTSGNDTYHAKTLAGGVYSMTLLAGTYNITASMFGYQTQTLTGQQYMTDTSPLQNFTLVPQTTYPVTGVLYEAGSCNPISGTVNILPPQWLTITTGTSGTYTANLPAGTYTMIARAGAPYQAVTTTLTVSGATTQNFTLGPAHDGTYVVDRPAFNWIPGTTQVTFDDPEDGYSALTIPFAFGFYGTNYTTINMSTNGYATFLDATYARMWANTEIPNPGPVSRSPSYRYPNAAIYPYWDDLAVSPRAYGHAYWTVSGTAPNRIFVMEWRGVAGTGAPVTFEVQLEETSNRITFLYQNIGGPYGYGYSATEGIENQAGTSAVSFGENWAGIVGDNQAYRFTPEQAPVITPCGATPTPTVTPTATATPCAITFTDVLPTDYFYEAVTYLYCHGVISGYADNTFRPYNNTTRGQMSKIVVLGFGIPIWTPSPSATPTFSDVPPDNAFYQYVETAAHNNIVSGYADGTFRPFANVTRGQLSKIIVVGATIVNGWPLLNPPTPTFSDVPANSPFYTYIETAYCHQIISGYADGSFHPNADATRGQISKIQYLAILNQASCAVTPTAVVPRK